MTDDRSGSHSITLRHLFPWLDILRATNLAFNPGKILLGALGSLLLATGWFLLGIPFVGVTPTPPVLAADATENQKAEYEVAKKTYQERLDTGNIVEQSQRFPWEPSVVSPPERFRPVTREGVNPAPWQQNGRFSSGYAVFEPICRYLHPFHLLGYSGLTAYGLLCAIWTLFVAAFVGGAISRMTALEFARDSTVGLGDAIRFAVKHLRGYIMGPVLPLAGSLIILLCCLIGGFVARLPALDVIMGVLWFLALLGGALLALALLGLAVIWPLMFPAISVEGTEGVDALTRGYSYLIGRPWNYFFYWLVALINGAAAMIVAVVFGYATVWLSWYAVSWGLGEENARLIYSYTPRNGAWRDAFAVVAVGGKAVVAPAGTKAIAAGLVGFWTHLVFMGIIGFAYSYFWTAATVIYFLMRRDVDEIDATEVDLDDEDDEPFPNFTTTAPAEAPSGGLHTIQPPPASAPPASPFPLSEPPTPPPASPPSFPTDPDAPGKG